MHLVVVVVDDDDDYFFSSDNLRIMFILVTSSFRTSSVSGQEGEGEVDRGRCQGESPHSERNETYRESAT